MTISIHPAVSIALVGFAIILLCVAMMIVITRSNERINASNNATWERTNADQLAHTERMEKLRIAAADRFIRLRVAEAYHVDTLTAQQLIMSDQVSQHLLN